MTTRRRVLRRAPELESLSILELRGYREELTAEEWRVSYWSRVLRSRLSQPSPDQARPSPVDDASLARLRPLLAAHRASSRALSRWAVTHAGPGVLPDVEVLWAAPTSEETASRLAAAERALDAYLVSLHERLDAATGELVGRYSDEPALALGVLPRSTAD